MRYAVISDIHGNKPALDAVLSDARSQGIESFIVAGDYCLSGPWPDQCLSTLRELERAVIIRGNEEYYLEYLKDKDQSQWTDGQMQISYWNYRNIRRENLDWLLSLVPSREFSCNEISMHVSHQLDDYIKGLPRVFFTHSSGMVERYGYQDISHEQIQKDIAEAIDQDELLKSLISSLDEGVYIFGHSHIQWSYKVPDKDVYVINPGSCGLPLDGVRNTLPYTILDIDDNGNVSIEERRVPFDLMGYADSIKDTTQYSEAHVWSEVIMRELKSSGEHLSFFLKFVDEYARSIGDEVRPFTVETWENAYKKWSSSQDDKSNA
jgi:predicted phosphodiesterase